MEVLRQIGPHTVLVNPSESCDISVEQSTFGDMPEVHDPPSLSKKQLLRTLANGDAYLPLSLYWELLDKCNFSCPFCYIVGHSANRVIRFAEMQQHLADLVEAGVLFCILTGGEAMLHPDFCEIYTFLKRSGVFVEVYTNGYKLNDDVVELFRMYRPYAIEVSLYSMSDEKLRSVYNARGGRPAATVRNNVLKLKANGLPVVCKTFLNTTTHEDLDEISRWCSENGLEHYSSAELIPAYDGVSLDHFKFVDEIADSRLQICPGQTKVCFPCGTKNYGCALTSAFEVYPCASIRHKDCYFDLRQLGVEESLHRMKTFIRTFHNSEIRGARDDHRKTCIAFAQPVRNFSGDILYFANR